MKWQSEPQVPCHLPHEALPGAVDPTDRRECAFEASSGRCATGEGKLPGLADLTGPA